MAAVKLHSREQRKKLPRPVRDEKSRAEPVWVQHSTGMSIGYRHPPDAGTAGHWLLREFKPGVPRGRYVKRTLGTADDVVSADGVSVLSWEDVQKIVSGADRPTLTRPGKHTVSAAWQAYSTTRATPVDARERSVWTRFIEPVLGSTEVSELTTHELKKWRNDQVKIRGNRGQSKGSADETDLLRRARYTANRRWTILRAILNNSYSNDTVKSDHAWRKVQPFANVDRPRTVTATAEQARKLLGVLTEPLLGLVSGSLYSGLRLSELLRLRRDDVDLTAARVRVRHSKGGKERWIPLTREGRDFFAERIKGDGPVLGPMSYTDISKAMRAASATAKIEPRLTLHDMRRSYGSLLLNAGAPIEAIQELLGHADPRMTRRAYAHLLDSTLQKTVKKLPNFAEKSKKG